MNAGAKRVILLGRDEAKLIETEKRLPEKGTNCSIFTVSVTDERALKDVAAALGTGDVLVLNAAFLSTPTSISETSVDDWWQSFEVCALA